MFGRLYSWLQGKHRRRIERYRPLNHIELSSAAVLHNVAVIQQQHESFSIIPVLKSNAYGHGLIHMAQILRSTPCELLAVDGYFEAARIRRMTKQRILVMGYILPENVSLVNTKQCSFVVQDLLGLEAFGQLKKPVHIHLEINTGMNRLGLRAEEIDTFLDMLATYPNLQLEGVMTHLADADNADSELFTMGQVELFDRLVEHILARGYRPKYIHVAQTAGSTKARSAYANALRLGIGLYGINPLRQDDKQHRTLADLRPVLELKSTIIKVIDLQTGEKVGYNGTYIAKRPTRIGVLPVGYYEGVPYALGNNGVVTVGNIALPIVGKVCMNHTMVDLKGTNLSVGNVVTVFSADPKLPNAVANLSKEHGLSPYVVLAGVAETIRRTVV